MKVTVTDKAGLERALEGKKAVVYFHSTWCPFCRSFKPVFERLTTGRAYEPMEAILDDDDNPLWAHFGIEAVPTVIFFEGGQPVRRLDARLGVGLREKDLVEALS